MNQRSNTCVIRAQKGEEKEDRTKNIFKEIIAENFPNLAKNKKLWI